MRNVFSPLDITPETGREGTCNVLVEIPRGSRNKYEIDEVSGLIRLDRYLYASSHYPGDYGFVPRTLAEDGDCIDALVMLNAPTFSGCIIEVRVLGMLHMIDRGAEDVKLLTVPDRDPLYEDVRDLGDVPGHYLREVAHFFATYKQLEGAEVTVEGWRPADEAWAALQRAIERRRGAGAHPVP